MTCCKLLVAVSTALIWAISLKAEDYGRSSSLGDIILVQAMQSNREAIEPSSSASNVDAGTEALMQMSAKKVPSKTPLKTKPKPAAKAPSKTVQPAIKRSPGPIISPPQETGRFQVAIPEDNGDLDIWGSREQELNQLLRHQTGLQAIINNFGSGVGFEYIYRQNSWFDWGITASNTKMTLEQKVIDGTEEFINGKTSTLKLFSRFFMTRRLYVGTGLNLSRLSGIYGWTGTALVDGQISTVFQTRMISADICLGSEWKILDSFYFGINWAGTSLLLKKSENFQENSDVSLTSKALTGATPDARLAAEMRAQLRFHYGILRFGYIF